MNIRALSDWKPEGLARTLHHTATRISRRQFARITGGTALAGALQPAISGASGSFAPVPIPGGSPVIGGAYHVFGPAAIDPVDAEPSSITNHNGFVGLAYPSGMVTRTNTKTGDIQRYPFLDADMRFMEGVFRGTDGRVHQGAFAFV